MPTPEHRRHSPAAERNGPAILAAMQQLLPPQGLMLEVASGTGQHAAHLSEGLPGWTWQPTDFDAGLLGSIRAWCAGLDRVRPPLRLDVLSSPWPSDLPASVDAMFCANMIHIAPWACTGALMQGAARLLVPHGVLLTYGPYLGDALPDAPSNLAFDADLRSRNPDWGVRHVAEVAQQARDAGLILRDRVAMPANNLLLVWRR